MSLSTTVTFVFTVLKIFLSNQDSSICLCLSVGVTGWAVAQACCISQCTKYRKSVIFGYPWEQNPWTNRHETWGA